MLGESSDGSLRLRPSSDDQAWDKLVQNHCNGTAFHLSGFLRTAAPLLGLRADLAVAEADGEVVGLVPMLRRCVGPLALVNHGLPFPYLGPLVAMEFSADDVLSAVRRYLHPRTTAHFRMQSVSVYAGLGPRGWEHRDTWTAAVIGVGGKNDDELLGTLSRQQRRNVRQAVERGLTAGPATSQEIDKLTGWARDEFHRQGQSARWPVGAHLKFYDALAPSGSCVATAVRCADELLAVSLDLILGDRMVGWEMGMSQQGRAYGASQILYLANMRRARDLGATEFDMLGAPTPGIARFKLSMGAEMRPRGYAVWEPRWLPSRRHLPSVRHRLG